MKNLMHKIITTNLLRIRISKRYSQEQIAAVLEIKQSSYNKIEGGFTRIRSDQLGVLAMFYKIDIGYFYIVDVDFNDDCTSLFEENKKMKEELKNLKRFNSILVKFNEELRDKIA